MIQLNDSESLVSVLEGFSDHRARAVALRKSKEWGQSLLVDRWKSPNCLIAC